MPRLIFIKMINLFVVIWILGFIGCASTAKDNNSKCINGYDLDIINNPSEIINKRAKYFNHEWKAINQKRDTTKSNNEPPPNTIGLALSGGGIRSNAFQLGILSGLYESKSESESRLLSKIDYISTVSGGSWAAASYLFTHNTDEQYFKELNSLNSRHLLLKQGKIFREDWRSYIVKGVLPDDNLLYRGLQEKPRVVKRLSKKPYFIINATHSNEPTEFPKECNFNIQFTRDFIMAPADCNSKVDGNKLCSPLQKFSWSLPTAGGFGKGFMVRNQKNSDCQFYVNTFPFPWRYTQELRISDILAASSAVITKLYGNWLRIKTNGYVLGTGQNDNLRDKYRLSDGGKSENLGALALIQRGVDLVIISQMAEDANAKYSDLVLLRTQVEKLFGLTINEKAIKDNITSGCHLYSSGKYGKMDKEGTINEEDHGGTIIFIKPTYSNISGFTCWLQAKSETESKYKDILHALKKDGEISKKRKFDICHKSGFPQHPTLCTKYEEGIIQAYYLLGKYVIEMTDIKERILEVVNSEK